MKEYLYILWLALTGCNPFRQELDDVHHKYEKTAENYAALQELYFKSLENNEAIGKKKDELQQRLTGAKAQVKSLQQLVENLRERISDKGRELEQQAAEYRERIERMKRDYQQRIDQYNKEIDRLRKPKK